MKNRLIIYGCLICVITAGVWSSSSDTWAARKFSQKDMQKKMESAGVDPDEIRKEMEESGAGGSGAQTKEDKLEELRKQQGDVESQENEKSAGDVEIPTGTHVMVKLDNALDSSEIGEGEQFTGRLQGDLVVDNVLLVSSGGKVYGTILTSTRARNVAGTSVLEFKLTDLLIENQMRSIASSTIRVESGKSGRLHANASIDKGTAVEFSIGELGSDVDQTQTISGPDKKATDRIDERRNDRRHRRD